MGQYNLLCMGRWKTDETALQKLELLQTQIFSGTSWKR